MRKFETIAAATILSAITSAALADARAIRIEPRPYTSVVVTVENGVRVWRPMPPTELVIVNPGNKASINLEIDAKSRQGNRNYNFNQGH